MTHDFSRSRAILIGNGAFTDPGIPDLPAAPDCVGAMAGLLGDELCGWPAERVTALVDVATPSELARRLVPLMREAEDVLLVYYVGHGLRTSEGQLALALGETERHPEMLPYTGMIYGDLARIMRGSRAATKLVILDCCHAELGGKANHILQSADAFDAHPVDGLYFIGASAKDKSAKAPLDGGLTYFTDAFVRVVRTGLPNLPPTLRLDQIFLALRDTLVRADQPEPVQSSIRDAQHFVFARNAAVRPAEPALLPESLRVALENPSPNVRRAAVEDLGALMAETLDRRQFTAARTRLLEVAEGDVPAVAETARRIASQPDSWSVGTVDGARFATAAATVGIALDAGNTEYPMLTGIRVEFGTARITLVATDRFRLAVREVPWTPAGPDGPLPPPIVVAGADLLRAVAGFDEAGEVGVCVTGSQFGLLDGAETALAGLLDIGYTEFRKLRPAVSPVRVTVRTAVLIGAIEDAIPDTAPGTRMAMTVENKGFFLSQQSDADAARPAWVPADVEGGPLQLILSPRYLLDALLTSAADRVSLAFTGSHSPVIIAPADGSAEDEFSWYCLMPMRLAS